MRGNITCRSKNKYCSLPDGCLFTKLTGEINAKKKKKRENLYYAREHLQQAYHKSSISSLCSEDPKMSEKMNEGMLYSRKYF